MIIVFHKMHCHNLKVLMVVVLVTAILCTLQVSYSSAKPIRKKPASIIESVPNNGSFFKRVIEKSVALVLFPLFITLEIIWNSTGAHSDIGSLDSNPAVDVQIHVICATILKLWTDLRTLEDSQRVYFGALENVVNAEESNANETYPDIISKIDRAYIEDSVLGKQYIRLKRVTAQEFAIPENHSDIESTLSWQDRDKLLHKNELLGSRMLLYKFHNELHNTGDDNQLAKTILAISKDDKLYNKVQQLFEKSLKEVGPSFGVKGTDEDAAKQLFENLRKNIVQDADLKLSFQKRIAL